MVVISNLHFDTGREGTQLVSSYVAVGVAGFTFNGFLAKAIKSAADFPFGTIRLIHVLTSFRSRESG